MPVYMISMSGAWINIIVFTVGKGGGLHCGLYLWWYTWFSY